MATLRRIVLLVVPRMTLGVPYFILIFLYFSQPVDWLGLPVLDAQPGHGLDKPGRVFHTASLYPLWVLLLDVLALCSPGRLSYASGVAVASVTGPPATQASQVLVDLHLKSNASQ